MKSLFLKIFLSFWLAQALFIVLAILVTVAMRPTHQISAVEALQPKFLSDAVDAYQTGGEPRVHEYLRGLRETQHVHAMLFKNGVPGLGILIAVISSGLVCYFLAQFLTSPIGRLRKAAQSLAAGDLSARVGGSSSAGGDEISQLVRDFDLMAAQIEKLVNAQSR